MYMMFNLAMVKSRELMFTLDQTDKNNYIVNNQ